MCRLVESIKVQDGRLLNIEWHNKRFNKARNEAFGLTEVLDLAQVICIPETANVGIYKCRVLYSEFIQEIQFEAYSPRQIKTLKLVYSDTIDYHLKYEDRAALAELVAQKGDADDILIVKDGCITDTSFSNIAFFDGKQWYTPNTYLLNGSKREQLLANGTLLETRITPTDLSKYCDCRMINAMLEWEGASSVTVLI